VFYFCSGPDELFVQHGVGYALERIDRTSHDKPVFFLAVQPCIKRAFYKRPHAPIEKPESAHQERDREAGAIDETEHNINCVWFLLTRAR